MKAQRIDPETADAGDTIQVVHAKHDGIMRTVSGVVHRRGDAGQFRTLYTEEGGELITWKRPNADAFHVYLLHRPDAEQQPLSIFDELAERIV